MKRPASDPRFSNGSIHVSTPKALNAVPLSKVQGDGRYVPVPVLLCIGLRPSLLKAQRANWKSAGCVVTSAATIPKAIVSIAAGDFDLVLLGERLPIEDRERLTFFIRSTGSAVPIVCIADICGRLEFLRNSTPRNDPETVLAGVTEILAENVRPQPIVTRRSRQA